MTAVIRDDLAQLAVAAGPLLAELSRHPHPLRQERRSLCHARQTHHGGTACNASVGRASQWTQTFQSLFGREEWLKPYTEQTLVRLAKQGVKRVFVAMPGFTSDCLETIDEIGREAREAFQHAGGEAVAPLSVPERSSGLDRGDGNAGA